MCFLKQSAASVHVCCVPEQTTEVFDAVVSAVGNYHEPNLPDVSGIRSFPGVQVNP